MQYHKALISFLSQKDNLLLGSALALDALIHEPVKTTVGPMSCSIQLVSD